MKNMLENLEKYLMEKGKCDFTFTGKDVMDKLNITLNNLQEECEEAEADLFNEMYIETSTKYFDEIKNNFDMDNEILWYKNKDDKDALYVTTIEDKGHKDCVYFMSDIFKEGNNPTLTISLIDIINKLQEIIKDEEIILTIVYDMDCYFKIKVLKDKAVVIDDDLANTNMTDHHKMIMFYHLLVLSYDKRIIDTLKEIELR